MSERTSQFHQSLAQSIDLNKNNKIILDNSHERKIYSRQNNGRNLALQQNMTKDIHKWSGIDNRFSQTLQNRLYTDCTLQTSTLKRQRLSERMNKLKSREKEYYHERSEYRKKQEIALMISERHHSKSAHLACFIHVCSFVVAAQGQDIA